MMLLRQRVRHSLLFNTRRVLGFQSNTIASSSSSSFVAAHRFYSSTTSSTPQSSPPTTTTNNNHENENNHKKKKKKDLSPVFITSAIIIIYLIKRRQQEGSTPSTTTDTTMINNNNKEQQEQQEQQQSDDPITTTTTNNNDGKIRIAIIGSGISGSAVAHYTTDIMKRVKGEQKLEIVIYESSDRIGGRLKTSVIGGKLCEVGGSHIIKDNYYAMRLLNGLGLHLGTKRKFYMVIWDGDRNEPVLVEDAQSSWNNLKEYLFRYAFGYPVWRTKSLMRSVFNQFSTIYQLQSCDLFNDSSTPQPMVTIEDLNGVYTFESVKDFVDRLQLTEYTTDTYFDHFCSTSEHNQYSLYWRVLGIQKRFLRELLEPILRINYLQNSDQLSAFAGGVATAGVFSDFYPIREGTASLPERLIQKQSTMNTTTLLNNRVHTIQYDEQKKRVHIHSTNVEQQQKQQQQHANNTNNEEEQQQQVEEVREFDYVVIATPLEFTNGGERIKIEGIERDERLLKDRLFKRVYVTMVVGHLNLKYFNVQDKRITATTETETSTTTTVDDKSKFIHHIEYNQDNTDDQSSEEEEKATEYGIVTLKPSVEPLAFNSILPIGKSRETNEPIFKIFSSVPISDEQIGQYFEEMSHCERHCWMDGAYPILNPPSHNNLNDYPPIKINDRLYYTSAFESLISTMETNLINSKNVSFMITKHVLNHREENDTVNDKNTEEEQQGESGEMEYTE